MAKMPDFSLLKRDDDAPEKKVSDFPALFLVFATTSH